MEKLFKSIMNTTINYHESFPEKKVGVSTSYINLVSSLDTVLPEKGESPETAIQKLIKGVENGLINSKNPRYFGFVIGGSTPTSMAADWLTSLWDQNAQVYNSSPAAAIIEDIVSQWLLDLLSLPENSSVGFVTGAQMANFSALTIARNTVLNRNGWDFDSNGLQGAPIVNLLCGNSCHGTIHSAIRMMGLGQKNIRIVDSDEQGRMNPKNLRMIIENCNGPVIICAQAGNVNTGAFDPFPEIYKIAKNFNAWLHIDGAFGLWARVSPELEALVSDVDKADSWTIDAHKWLNVPYDSGIVIIRDKSLHQNLKTTRCSYTGLTDINQRDGSQWVPENSRRARGFVLYAALRNIGRAGVRNIIENGCSLAHYFSNQLSKLSHARILNKIVLNQVLCRFEPVFIKDLDNFNMAVASRIQNDGICWLGTTQWNGQTALRISISNSTTTKEDINKSISSIQKSIEKELGVACNNDSI